MAPREFDCQPYPVKNQKANNVIFIIDTHTGYRNYHCLYRQNIYSRILHWSLNSILKCQWNSHDRLKDHNSDEKMFFFQSVFTSPSKDILTSSILGAQDQCWIWRCRQLHHVQSGQTNKWGRMCKLMNFSTLKYAKKTMKK